MASSQSQPSVIAASQVATLLALDGTYIDYRVAEEYEWYNGQVPMPVAYQTGQPAPPTTAYDPTTLVRSRPAGVFSVPASLPYGVRAVAVVAVRIGKLPALPAPLPQSNEQLLDFQVRTTSPVYTVDGKNIYSAAAFYTYLQITPAGTADGYVVGLTPLDTTPQARLTAFPQGTA